MEPGNSDEKSSRQIEHTSGGALSSSEWEALSATGSAGSAAAATPLADDADLVEEVDVNDGSMP